MKKNTKSSIGYSTLISIILILLVIALLVIPSNSQAQGSFKEYPPMPTARLAFGTAVEWDMCGAPHVFVIGGLSTETDRLAVVEMMWPAFADPEQYWFTGLTPMPTARGGLGCAAVDGKIYAIGGGHPDPVILNTLEVHDSGTDTWDTTKTDMPTARANVAVSAVNGKIYVIGGSKGGSGIWEGLSTVEEYDPQTDTWTLKMDKPTPGWCIKTCVLDGKIWATGGNIKYPNISDALEVYDPVTDSWDTTKARLPMPMYSHSTSVVDGKIYLFGGWDNCAFGPMYQTVWVYDPDTDVWTPIGDMPFAIGELSTVALGRKICLIGGTSTLHPFTSIDNVYEYDPYATSSVEDSFASPPSVFGLFQNYPNPFNPETIIPYQIPESGHVLIEVYNSVGQRIRMLLDEPKQAGLYSVIWDGRNDFGQLVSNGIYLYRMTSGGDTKMMKCVFMK